MNIYFISGKKQKTKEHESIQATLKKLGCQTTFRLVDGAKEELPDDFDAMIVDSEDSSLNLSYQIVIALTNRKPVLCLCPKSAGKPENIIPPAGRKVLSYLTIKKYTKDSLPEILRNFVGEVGDKGDINRFNFILSSDISEYLNWVPFGKRQTKSDFVRQLIREEIEKDKKYQAHMKKGK